MSQQLLLRQLETAWALTTYHLDGLTTDECVWRSAIAWLTSHLGFRWSMVLDHSFGGATLTREQVR